jgi:O-antigen ligase
VKAEAESLSVLQIWLDAPRWVLLAALVFAPWFYGGTTEEGIVATTWCLTAAVVLWIAGIAVRRWRAPEGEERRPLVPVLLVMACALLLILGWWMALNAKAVYDPDLAMFVRLPNIAPRLPGSVDQAVSAAWMWRGTALLGSVCMVAHACRNPVWLMRVCTVVGATGGSIALLGLLQKASRAPMIFWREVDPPVTTFFATFYYHGNAGAFISMTLPVTIGLALRAFGGKGGPFARAVWSALAVISVIAAFGNTSRMGHAVALGVVLVVTVVLFLRSRRVSGRINWITALIAGTALLLVGYAVTETAGVEHSLGRWEHAGEIIPLDARWVVAKAALQALPEAGWFGFGPGSFHVVFPYLTGATGEGRLGGFWRHLHQDYLQTMLEWGWIGAAAWAVLFLGGLAVAVRSWMSAKRITWRPRQRILLPLVALGLGAVALHGAVDFPLQVVSIELYAAVYLGICWSSGEWEGESRKARVKTPVRSTKESGRYGDRA